MNKVIVIGCPGSGKSTFSRVLQKKTGLLLYHLDLIFWNADKTMVEKSVFRERLTDILDTDEWIIDGNYSATMDWRMSKCDTVFFLDFSTEVCLEGIKERRGKPRSDMPWFETEEDAEFLDFIKKYNVKERPKVLDLLKKYSDKNIIIFKSREEADEYISLL